MFIIIVDDFVFQINQLSFQEYFCWYSCGISYFSTLFLYIFVFAGLEDGSGLSANKMDIQRQMEELNKQIEMQKSEITSITKNIATAESELVGSALASIALPSNLQQILDSIKTIGSTTPGESSDITVRMVFNILAKIK